jgi:hypothetical protein
LVTEELPLVSVFGYSSVSGSVVVVVVVVVVVAFVTAPFYKESLVLFLLLVVRGKKSNSRQQCFPSYCTITNTIAEKCRYLILVVVVVVLVYRQFRVTAVLNVVCILEQWARCWKFIIDKLFGIGK